MSSTGNALTEWLSDARRRLRPALKRATAAQLATEVGQWISDVGGQQAEVSDVDHVCGTASYVVCGGESSTVVTAWGLGSWPAIRDRGPLARCLLESLRDPTDHECDLMISARAEEEWVLGSG
jgi:hypothetical protein